MFFKSVLQNAYCSNFFLMLVICVSDFMCRLFQDKNIIYDFRYDNESTTVTSVRLHLMKGVRQDN